MCTIFSTRRDSHLLVNTSHTYCQEHCRGCRRRSAERGCCGHCLCCCCNLTSVVAVRSLSARLFHISEEVQSSIDVPEQYSCRDLVVVPISLHGTLCDTRANMDMPCLAATTGQACCAIAVGHLHSRRRERKECFDSATSKGQTGNCLFLSTLATRRRGNQGGGYIPARATRTRAAETEPDPALRRSSHANTPGRESEKILPAQR